MLISVEGGDLRHSVFYREPFFRHQSGGYTQMQHYYYSPSCCRRPFKAHRNLVRPHQMANDRCKYPTWLSPLAVQQRLSRHALLSDLLQKRMSDVASQAVSARPLHHLYISPSHECVRSVEDKILHDYSHPSILISHIHLNPTSRYDRCDTYILECWLVSAIGIPPCLPHWYPLHLQNKPSVPFFLSLLHKTESTVNRVSLLKSMLYLSLGHQMGNIIRPHHWPRIVPCWQ